MFPASPFRAIPNTYDGGLGLRAARRKCHFRFLVKPTNKLSLNINMLAMARLLLGLSQSKEEEHCRISI